MRIRRLALTLAFAAVALSAPVQAEAQTSTADATAHRHYEFWPSAAALNADVQAAAERVRAPSPLEAHYSRRAGEDLRLFGLDAFTPAPGTSNTAPAMTGGAVQDDYVLGPGDRLSIVLRGQIDLDARVTIGADGMLVAKHLRPVNVAGRSLGDVRDQLEQQVATRMVNTDLFLSLSTVRRIGVFLAGEVEQPGRAAVTALDTLGDALLRAGGPKAGASLRSIMRQRHGEATMLDLYPLLTGEGAADLSLAQGDRFSVPPAGATIAVAGAVRRPAIFELPPGQTSIALANALKLAGGPLVPGRRTGFVLSPDTDGTDRTISLTEAVRVSDGDIIIIQASAPASDGLVTLAGHVREQVTSTPGLTPRLSDLLGSGAGLKADAWPLIAALERTTMPDRTRQRIAIAPAEVMAGRFDMSLRPHDRLVIFSRAAVAAAMAEPDTDADAGTGTNTQTPPGTAGNRDAETDAADAKARRIRAEVIEEYGLWLRAHGVRAGGAVHSPGLWPVAPGVAAGTVIDMAGGPTARADTASIEITRTGKTAAERITGSLNGALSDATLSPGDAIRINPRDKQLQDGAVVLAGAVARPGIYDLMRGERLSDLLARAGGLSDEADPRAAIFTREATRAREEAAFRRAASELDRALALSLLDPDDAPDADRVRLARALSAELRNVEATGRVIVEADPAVLAARPELDILLQPGDRIIYPRLAPTVTVSGEVLSPASLQYDPAASASDYIRMAGGTTHYADRSRAFILMPDGSARPLRASMWHHGVRDVPPGATIIVPRDPDPFDFLEFTGAVGNILSQLAITTASLVIISEND